MGHKIYVHTFAGLQARHMLNLNADAVQAELFHENVLQRDIRKERQLANEIYN